MFEAGTAHIFAVFAYVADHNAYITNGHFGHVAFFYLYRPVVDVVGTGQYYLRLQTAATTIFQEAVNVLEVVVAFHHSACYLALGKWFTVQSGYNAHHALADNGLVDHSYLEQEGVDTV